MTSVPRRYPEINTYAAAYHPTRTYYVSTDGVDQTNAGSFMRPFRPVRILDPRAFETGTLCRFQNAPHGLKASEIINRHPVGAGL